MLNTRKSSRSVLLTVATTHLLAAGTLNVWNSSAKADAVPVRVLAYKGARADGMPPSQVFSGDFDSYTMTNSGPVWVASIGGTAVPTLSANGLFRGFSPTLLSRAGDVISEAPLMVRGSYLSASSVRVTPSGLACACWGQDIRPTPYATYNSIWGGTFSAGLRLVARVGDHLPGGDLTPKFSKFIAESTGGIADNGNVVFQAKLVGTGISPANDDVLMLDAAGTKSIIIGESNPVPGVTGALFGDSANGSGLNALECSPQLNNAGNIVFNAPIYGTGISSSNNKVMCTAKNSSDVRVILRKGGAAPGFPANSVVTDFGRPQLTTNGYLSVVARVSTLGSSRRISYVYTSSGWTRHLAELDDPAPGFATGWSVAKIDGSWVGSNGGVLTMGVASGPDATNHTVSLPAIWYGALGRSQLVMAKDGVAPGLGVPNARFSSFETPCANSSGEVVFKATAYYGSHYCNGIWAWDAVRGLRLLISEEQTLSDSVFGNHVVYHVKLNTTFSTTPTDTLLPQAAAINDSGEVVFEAVFTDSIYWTLCSLNVRSARYSLPVFRPTSAPAVESPAVFTTLANQAGYYRINAYRLKTGETQLTGDMGYLADPNLVIVGNGDFNADGILDIVWQNLSSGYCTVWLMQDGSPWPSQTLWLGASDAAGGWRIRTVCDMDSNGTPDIIWQNNTTGRAGGWLVSYTGGQLSVTWIDLWAANNLPWTIKAAADMTGDGQPDLVVRFEGAPGQASNGAMFVWHLKNLAYDGLTWLTSGPNLDFKLVGVADVDRDGGSDLIWWRTDGGTYNGTLSYWRMSGTRFLEAKSIYGSVDPTRNSIAPISPVLAR